MATNVIEIEGKRFVVVPELEYRRLRDNAARPELPPADAKGRRPALETMRALLARDVLDARQRLGMTQAELADTAGIRQETISRLEAGKHAPSVETMEKIDRAIKAAERKKR